MSKLKITVLGEFSLTYRDTTINEQNSRSKKLWILLEYLITHFDREIPQNELIELLWEENESENPAGALKTLMHRLRSMLDSYGIDSKNYILNNRNSYSWNKNSDFTLDSMDFINLCKNAENINLSRTRRINYYAKAMELYKGDYLSKSSLEQWVIPINVYYHSIYIKAVKNYIELLHQVKKLEEILSVCEKAVIFDPYDEKIHYNLIKVLVEMGDYPSAISQYNYVKNLYYTKFGVNPSSELTALYEETVKSKNKVQQNLDIVLNTLEEKHQAKGAFYCEYEFFKYIYRLEMREAARSKRVLGICLLTVKSNDNSVPEQKVLNKAMQSLSDCTCLCLRKRDVYSRFSVCQFILMLPSADEKALQTVMERIKKRFAKNIEKLQINLEMNYKVING